MDLSAAVKRERQEADGAGKNRSDKKTVRSEKAQSTRASRKTNEASAKARVKKYMMEKFTFDEINLM